jgi:hypothetical protein
MDVERNVKRFNDRLKQLVDEHRMFRKLGAIDELAQEAPEEVVRGKFNSWDDQMKQFTVGAQKWAVGKMYMGVHDNSPEFKFWLPRVRRLRALRAHKIQPRPDPHNLYRSIKSEGCPNPSALSLQEVEVKLALLEAELEKVKERSPADEHLARWLKAAKEREDEVAVNRNPAMVPYLGPL